MNFNHLKNYLSLLFLLCHWTLTNCQNNSGTNSNDILNWEAPIEIKNHYPYYLSGHDTDGAPVWFINFGHWDTRSFLEKHAGKVVKDTEKYLEQMFSRFTHPQLFSQGEEPQDNFNVVVNMQGFTITQMTHILTVQQWLTAARLLVTELKKTNYNFKHAYIVNSNYVFQTLWNLMRPLIGRVNSLIELHGTDPNKWKPILLRNIPRDQLPTQVGGTKDIESLQVYG